MRPLTLAALGLCLAGCPPKAIDFGPAGEVKSADELLKWVTAAEDQVRALKGDAKLRVDSPKAKGVITVFVAVSRPDRLHFESVDFFGRPMAILAADSERFGVFQAEEGAFYRGPASPENVSRFLPVVLPGRELTALLLGEAPRIAHESAELSLDERARAYQLVLRQGEVTQTLTVHPTRHRVLASAVRGVRAYDVVFDDFQDTGAISFPRKVVLTAKAAESVIELRYKDIALNEPVDASMFELEPPPGARVVEVDARGNPRAAGEVKP